MNKLQKQFQAVGIFFILAGIFSLILPNFFPNALTIVAGIVLILFAGLLLFLLWRYKKNRLPFTYIVVEAAYSAVLGIALLLSKWIGIDTSTVLIIWIMLFSGSILRVAVVWKELKIKTWWLALLLALFGICVVLFMLLQPYLAGAYFSYLCSFYFILAGLGLISAGYNSKVGFVIKASETAGAFFSYFRDRIQKRRFRRKEQKASSADQATKKHRLDDDTNDTEKTPNH